MRTGLVTEFLELIGVTGVTVEEANGGVQAYCPFARWLHQDNDDNRATLYVTRLDQAHPQVFTCSECGATGSLPELVYQLQALTGHLYPEAIMMLAEFPELSQQPPKSPRRRIRVDAPASKTKMAKPVTRNAIPEDVLADFPLLEGCELTDAQTIIEWLHHERGIKPSMIFKHKLRLYVDPLIGDLGVVLPVFDPATGHICELWAMVMGNEKPFRLQTETTKTSANQRTASALFGIELVGKGEPLFMVQSPIGALKLESLGLAKVVAVLGQLTPETLRLGHTKTVYLAFDDTQPGRDMVRLVHKHINADRIYFLRWSETRMTSGKHLFHSDKIENLDQLKQVFAARIVLGQA